MFNIHSSTDRLKLLKADFEKLMQDPLSISLAEKTCSDAWHLSDWVFSGETGQIDQGNPDQTDHLISGFVNSLMPAFSNYFLLLQGKGIKYSTS